MSKLFDDFDLDLQKIKSGIQPRDSEDETAGSSCTSGSGSIDPIPTWTAKCTHTCLFC